MNEYTYIIFDHNGRRLGKIEFGVRNSVPSAKVQLKRKEAK